MKKQLVLIGSISAIALLIVVIVFYYYHTSLRKDAVAEIISANEKRDDLIDELPYNRYWEIPENILISYLLDRKIKTLSGPEGNELDLDHPEIFEGLSPRDWRTLRDHRNELVPILLGRLKDFDNSAALILGYLKAKEALPLLRNAFIKDDYFYGWEGSMVSEEVNYTHHYCYEEAIEHITGMPIEKYIKLSKAEIKDLKKRKAQGKEVATYVLYRLAGEKW